MTERFTDDDFNDVPTLRPAEDLNAGDGAALLDELAVFVRRYVVLTLEQLTAVVLWVAHTHAFSAAETTPYLHVTSPEPESGKTRLLEVLELLVAKAWFTGRVTAAVLARKVDKVRPTLLLDESDAAFGGEKEYAETLRGILNSGYRAGGKASLCIKRGADFDFADLSTFSPKAVAGLRELPDTVASRSIRLELKRKTDDELAERFRQREARVAAAPLREALECWAAATVDALALERPSTPDELRDRAADCWEPLLAIADMAGGEWPERARRAAVALSSGGEREETLGRRLLADIAQVFDERQARHERDLADKFPSAELVAALIEIEDAPWAEYRGKGLTVNQLAVLLRPYKIRPKGIRVGDETPRGYEREQFEEAWKRYVPANPPSGPQHRNNGSTTPDSGDSEVQHDPTVLQSDNGDIPLNEADVADVAVQREGYGEARPLDELFGAFE